MRCLVFSLVLGAALFAVASATLPKDEYDVVIIGAGLSGVNTAQELARTWAVPQENIAILEAKDRIGGRTFSDHTTTIKGEPTRRDLGAEFVSPEQQRLNLYLDLFGIKKSKVMQNGRSVFQHATGDLHFSSWDLPVNGPAKLCLAKGFALLAWYARDIDVNNVWKSDNAAKYDSQTVHDFANGIFGMDAARRVFETLMSVMYGSDTKDMPLLHLLYFIKSTGGLSSLRTSGDYHVVNGTQQVSEGLRARAPDVHLSLSTPVTHIEWAADHAVVTAKDKDGNEFIVKAKRVVQTVPAPLTRLITYNPPLPEGRDQFTSNTAMGRYTKIHVRCPERHWAKNDLLKMAISYPGPLVTFVDGSYNAGEGDEGMLVGFLLGKFADQWLALSYEDREAAVKAQLHDVLDSDQNVNTFTNCVYGEYHWEKDPWARGVTVNLKTGLLSNEAIARAIREPMGAVHFAGTETSSVWHGYMEGALASGERVAEEVAHTLFGEQAVRAQSVGAYGAAPVKEDDMSDPWGLGLTEEERASLRGFRAEEAVVV